MGVFSELDLENQQTELDGHNSKAAEVQTLQAKLIQQHEQKKAAAAHAPAFISAAFKTMNRVEKGSLQVRKLAGCFLKICMINCGLFA